MARFYLETSKPRKDHMQRITAEHVGSWAAHCDAKHASALENFRQLVVFVDEMGLGPAEAEALLGPAKLLLAEAHQVRLAAHRRQAAWHEHHDAADSPPPPPPPPVTGTSHNAAPRPRARRQRHVAAATSSSGDGDPPPRPHRPARGLATCPLCTDLEIARPHCWLCFGLGFVTIGRRNDYKNGLR